MHRDSKKQETQKASVANYPIVEKKPISFK
jgi:hypothetical protein